MATIGSRQLLAEHFARLALQAAVEIMAVYGTGCAVRTKADASPVSEADERAEAVILAGLRDCAPGIPVLAEEAAARGDRPYTDGRFILVDPVDGTREFLSRNGEFTVNIALVEDGRPTVGVVYAPALRRLWIAAEGRAALAGRAPGALPDDGPPRRLIKARQAPAALVAMASRSHGDPRTEAFLAHLPVGERRSAGSSLKFCLLAEGEADVYPRFGPTMEWDTAAGDAVLRAAGGTVLGLDGRPLAYGKAEAGYRNEGFVAWGDPAAAARAG